MDCEVNEKGMRIELVFATLFNDRVARLVRWSSPSGADTSQNGSPVPPSDASLLSNVSKVALGFAAGLSTGRAELARTKRARTYMYKYCGCFATVNAAPAAPIETTVDEGAELARAIKEAESLSKFKSKQQEHRPGDVDSQKQQQQSMKPKIQTSSWVSLGQAAKATSQSRPPKKSGLSLKFGLSMGSSKSRPGSMKKVAGPKASQKAVVPGVFADDEDTRPKPLLNLLEGK